MAVEEDTVEKYNLRPRMTDTIEGDHDLIELQRKLGNSKWVGLPRIGNWLTA